MNLPYAAKANASGAHVFAAALKRHGVEVIFGQSIPSALFLAAPEYGIRQVGYRTENAGAAMADAYARVSHKVPVVTGQNGPAATLLVAGLAEAFKASIPVVAIVQDVHRAMTDRNAFQELDHLELFKGVSKWVRRVSETSRIDDYVDMAFTAAASGRPGPAVLIAPIDMFDEIADRYEHPRRADLGTFPLDRMGADPEAISRAADLLLAAKRPIVIAGGGVHVSGACEALAKLQETAALPVATTAMGKGTILETHPLSLGPVGYFMGTRGRCKYLRDMVADADVVLLVGNRTNQNGTDSWQLYPKGAQYIHIDIDPQEIGRNYEADVRIVADARLALEALAAEIAGRDRSQREGARAAVEEQIAAGLSSHRQELDALAVDRDGPLRPEGVMRDLDGLLRANDIVVADASYSSIWVANFLTIRQAGQRILTPRGLAGLGWGLPYAIGAKAARPDARVVGLVGDGGFAHVWSELETSRRMGLPVTLIVLNNQILGYQKHAEKVIWGDHSDVVDFNAVDHAAIARACGLQGVRVERQAEFLPALEKAMAADLTTVIDVVTDERAYPPITMFEDEQSLNY
ncbi:acetolactate synthase catalytic subunit [Pseudohoeflea coraliihabitans]|uniref:Acetolactate synthase catalytic subunit n=1 Tax=Pseudohoeflea coraliihabitans TaxID=2860393 RepID=A0ABS6WN50_9HYPH|nr:acetolactate synthase catalytic subunit [Pseudohoeflea sp. DP4N28-3]MBW3097220.1 acetolactate synthase catalytic subunit [Pseudohoeflea sp. DP4N28-3]